MSPESADIRTEPLRVRPPSDRIHRRAIAWWLLSAALLWLPIVAALITAAVLWPTALPWLIGPIVAASAFLLAKLAVEPWARYRVHRWEITEHATYAASGWLVREWRVAPSSRIQTVDAVRGPLEQLLGLATLRVTTASSLGAVTIPGLDRATAELAAARLARVAELTQGDAT